MRSAMVALSVTCLLAGVLPVATAQVPTPQEVGSEYLDFTFVPESTLQYVTMATSGRGPNGEEISQVATFHFVLTDQSFDTGSATGLPPGGPNSNALVTYHYWAFEVGWVGGVKPGDWIIGNSIAPPGYTLRGQSFDGIVSLLTPFSNTQREASIYVKARMNNGYGSFVERTETFTAVVYPSPAIQLQLIYTNENLKAKPNTPVVIPVQISNGDLYPQKVDIAVTIAPAPNIDPQSIAVLGLNPVVLDPLETRTVNITIITPKATTWYRSATLLYTVSVTNSVFDNIGFRTDGVMVIDGFYFSRPLLVVVPILLLLLLFFIIVLLVGKRYYDEHILGKPIPPWRLPDEARMLERLRREAPREFYITRYFLMVEEYESALNWFYSYKRRNKKILKRTATSERLAEKAALLKEPALDKFDRRAGRIKKRIHRRQERRRLKLEAQTEKLQGKLDRRYEEDFEKSHEKWEKKVEKLKRKASKPWFKAHKKWEKDVEKILEDWEKPFSKEKSKREKEITRAKEKYEAQVKKKDKDTWKAWRESVAAAERENDVREKEGRDPLPMPELVSAELGAADLPKPFKEPPPPKLPAEPREPDVKGLPPEPKLASPKLEASGYARKLKRLRKKADRKVARLEKKLGKLLARNERDRVRAIAKAGRDREKLLRKSHRAIQPTLREKLFRQTPEDRERRAHKKLLKALTKERYRSLKEAEATRLEVLEADAARREAELVSKLLREGGRAEVRKGSGASGARIEQDPQILRMREENAARIAKERAATDAKVRAEKERLKKELDAALREELVKERAAKAQAREAAAAGKAAKKAEGQPSTPPPAKKPKGKK